MAQWIKKNALMLATVVSLMGSIAIGNTMSYMAEGTAYTNSTVAFLVFVFSAALLCQAYYRIDFSDKRGVIMSLLFSVFISAVLLVGKQLHTVENCDFLSAKLWINTILLCIYFEGFVLFFLQWIVRKTHKNSEIDVRTDNIRSKKQFFVYWIAIMVCWAPVFFAFYPGAFVYDAQDEYVQVATREFTTHHPLLHVLLLGGAVCFGNKFMGSYNAGIALYTLFQMVVFSGVLSYSIYFVMELAHDKSVKVKKWTERVLVAFYGLFPVFPMYAVCSSKDTFFHASLLVVFIQLVKICQHIFLKDREATLQKRIEEIFVIASSCMMLLRNNAVYAYAVLFFAMFLLSLLQKYKKEIGRGTIFTRLLVCMLLSLLVYKATDKGLAYASQFDGKEEQALTLAVQDRAYYRAEVIDLTHGYRVAVGNPIGLDK